MFCKTVVLQLGQRTSENLYTISFLVKMKDGLTINSFIGISFLWNTFVDGCLLLEINTPRQCNWHFWSLVSSESYKSHSVRINSKCSDAARTNQASAMELSCKNIWRLDHFWFILHFYKKWTRAKAFWGFLPWLQNISRWLLLKKQVKVMKIFAFWG